MSFVRQRMNEMSEWDQKRNHVRITTVHSRVSKLAIVHQKKIIPLNRLDDLDIVTPFHSLFYFVSIAFQRVHDFLFDFCLVFLFVQASSTSCLTLTVTIEFQFHFQVNQNCYLLMCYVHLSSSHTKKRPINSNERWSMERNCCKFWWK